MVFVAPLALLLAFWLPGCADGWLHTDSHYYAAMGLEAWRSGELVELRLGDVPYYNKPPLALLIHGWFLDVLGANVWAARLPSLLAAMGATTGLVKLVSMLGGRRLALLAGLVLVTTVEFTRYTRAVSLDLWLACAMAWSLVALAWAWRDHRPERLLLVGVGVGFGLLIKPVVALFVLPVAGTWLWMTGRGKRHWWGWLTGAVVVAVALAAPWFVLMASRHPREFAETFFVKQSLERLAWETDRSWWYYLRIAAESYWPWLPALIGAAAVCLRAGWARLVQRPLLLLAWTWSVAWLVLISATGDKHGRYAVPAYLMLCVPVAWWTTLLLPRAARALRRAAFTALAPAAVVCGLLAAMAGFFGAVYQRPRAEMWDLLAAQVQAPGAAVRCTPMANKLAAHLVLLGRPWPHVADEGAPAAPGDVLLLHSREIANAGVRGEQIAAGDGVVAVRLAERWPVSRAHADEPENGGATD